MIRKRLTGLSEVPGQVDRYEIAGKCKKPNMSTTNVELYRGDPRQDL